MTEPAGSDISADPKVKTMYALGDAGENHRPLQVLAGEWEVVMHMFPAPGETITSIGMIAQARNSRRPANPGGDL